MLKIKFILSFVLITLFAAASNAAQTIPEGKWRLVAYSFSGKVSHPLPEIDITLNIHADGKLGGKSGCNAYGGEYTVENSKLKIWDIISTMMAFDEPPPQFEHDFYGVLNSATKFKVRKRELTLTDRFTNNFLRFVDAKDDK